MLLITLHAAFPKRGVCGSNAPRRARFGARASGPKRFPNRFLALSIHQRPVPICAPGIRLFRNGGRLCAVPDEHAFRLRAGVAAGDWDGGQYSWALARLIRLHGAVLLCGPSTTSLIFMGARGRAFLLGVAVVTGCAAGTPIGGSIAFCPAWLCRATLASGD